MAIAVLLVLMATLAFGPQVWEAFAASTQFTRSRSCWRLAIPAGTRSRAYFPWVRMRRGSVATAYTLQAAVTLAVGVTLIRLWRSTAPFALKAAALCLSAMLA